MFPSVKWQPHRQLPLDSGYLAFSPPRPKYSPKLHLHSWPQAMNFYCVPDSFDRNVQLSTLGASRPRKAGEDHRQGNAKYGQKVALPCLLPSDGWKKTGRWESTGAEMFKVEDRKGSEFCLAPTHEEEITQLVASEISSWKQLPLRLYQIGRKYRDEARPRSGLLRAREFVMKDMYSFDVSEKAALETYAEVRGAYNRILKAIGIPFAAAEADTGNIGGTRSHEYHFLSNAGEDTVLTCQQCGYTANEERAVGVISGSTDRTAQVPVTLQDCKDRSIQSSAVINIAEGRSVNPTKLKQSSVLKGWDYAFPQGLVGKVSVATADAEFVLTDAQITSEQVSDDKSTLIGDFTTIESGDTCAICHSANRTSPASTLESHRAIEIGHTFFLGTKYSSALGATVKNECNEDIPIQMGCYGIGVTRMIAAVVEASNDQSGIKWPESIAPFKACVVPVIHKKSSDQEKQTITDGVKAVYHTLTKRFGGEEIVIDDREALSVGFKLKDAALVGYPWVIVVGKSFLTGNLLEVHDRHRGNMKLVRVDDMHKLESVN
ncbi:proline---tRNA ligase [Powellomyces hirtus]|uniref:proline--tRNA ligase n=1 Tax=Powellomyces hirtus TaxID=109895 RepID=A0A507E9I4_9FUNG|nr:proline---tRNA ligase [Powellomyces hirtus]